MNELLIPHTVQVAEGGCLPSSGCLSITLPKSLALKYTVKKKVSREPGGKKEWKNQDIIVSHSRRYTQGQAEFIVKLKNIP